VSTSHGCERCGELDHCACYHDACCTCGGKEHGSCGSHPTVDRAVEHGDNCVICTDVTQLATSSVAMGNWSVVGEEGCTLYVPLMPIADRQVTLEFDTSPETLQQLRDALYRLTRRP
jgi:hypothetical protein